MHEASSGQSGRGVKMGLRMVPKGIVTKLNGFTVRSRMSCSLPSFISMIQGLQIGKALTCRYSFERSQPMQVVMLL